MVDTGTQRHLRYDLGDLSFLQQIYAAMRPILFV
jgi:hypothetical protein